MVVIPFAVTARLQERFIFNFRINPDTLDRIVPAPYLKPQVINGWSVASFCILRLDQLIMAPLPAFLGYHTVSSAWRCGIIDTSTAEPQPSVYITDRNTDLPIVSRLGPWLFADTIQTVRSSIVPIDGGVQIGMNYLDLQRIFSAHVTPMTGSETFRSEVFESIEEFTNFMRLGVSSYTPSIYGDALAKVDLRKEERPYQPLNAEVEFSALDGVWQDAGILFDSAVRASGGKYTWIYRGLAQTVGDELVPEPTRLSAKVVRGLQRTSAA